MEKILASIESRVNDRMNGLLVQNFTKEEVSTAMFQMNPRKASSPDGFPISFYQNHWDSVRDLVAEFCLNILNKGGDVTNHTYIALIPKYKNPEKAGDYCPINLYNVSYKIIAKMLANRLKAILKEIIAPYQCAFVPNRLITDNIIIGYECLHKIRYRRKGKQSYMTLKLDISKAYDRIEWNFLKAVMLKLGFD